MPKSIIRAAMLAVVSVNIALILPEIPADADIPGWNWFTSNTFGTSGTPNASGSGAVAYNSYQANTDINITTGIFDTNTIVNAPPDNNPNDPAPSAQNGFSCDLTVYPHWYPNTTNPPKGSGITLTTTFIWFAGADAAASFTTQNSIWTGNTGKAHATTTVQINGSSLVPTDNSQGLGDPLEAKSPIPLTYGGAMSETSDNEGDGNPDDNHYTGSYTGTRGRDGLEIFQNGNLVYGNQMDNMTGFWTLTMSIPNINEIWGAWESDNRISINTQATAFNGSCAGGYGIVSEFFTGSPAN